MAITIPLRALLPYALGALEYLLRPLLAPAPQSVPVGQPYFPPFTGGQCVGISYRWRVTMALNGDYSNPFVFEANRVGAITQPYARPLDGGLGAAGYFSLQWTESERVSGSNYDPSRAVWNFQVLGRVDNQPDNCGDTPNPNPNPPVSNSGLADSGSPNLDNSPIVQSGIPVLAIPSFMSALLAALNAAKSASDALAGVRAIAEAIEAIADLLNALKDKADKDKKKDDPNNKEITRHDFGSIRFDGYLRLYPSTGTNEREAIYIDLQLLSIPIWYGKYFGRSSPNFYRFKSLGYISFTSPTFGIIETKEIEFSRMSLNVPPNASGFFYHLGLEGDIVGNISAFYQKPK